MNITIRQVQVFIAVAKHRSFVEAGDAVRLSQPAMSIAIKNLEDAVGGKLLERSTRSVLLTPEGEAFYVVAQQLLSDWERGLEDVKNAFALQKGRLLLASMPTFANSLLPGLLARYHRLYPGINVTVNDVIGETVVDLVASGRVELGITFDPGEVAEISFQPLFRDAFVVALPGSHNLLKKKTLHWQDLAAQPFIGLRRPSSIRSLIEQTLATQGVSLLPIFEANQISVIGRMISEGLGVSVLPAISAAEMAEMGVACRPLEPTISRQVGIISRQRSALSAPSNAFIEVILAWAEDRAKT